MNIFLIILVLAGIFYLYKVMISNSDSANITEQFECNTCGTMGTCVEPKCKCEADVRYAYRTIFPQVREESYTGCYNGGKCNQDLLNYIDLRAIETNNKVETEPKPVNLQMNNHIPNHLISKVQLYEPHDFEIEPANNYVSESPSFFESQFTNLSLYFKQNPELFSGIKDKRNMIDPTVQSYVPYQREWQDASDCFNNVLYDSVPKSPPINFIARKVQY